MCEIQTAIIQKMKQNSGKKGGITFENIRESVKIPYYDLMTAFKKLEKSNRIRFIGLFPDQNTNGSHKAYYRLNRMGA
jgi:hypothetical protein